MVVFDLEQIIKTLGVTPQELREIANRMEVARGKPINESEKIKQEYKIEFIKQLREKRDGRN